MYVTIVSSVGERILASLFLLLLLLRQKLSRRVISLLNLEPRLTGAPEEVEGELEMHLMTPAASPSIQ